ncbi:MAG: tetratricopeptide repeat protein [Alphaproteobacteria bacterium]|nr:tetratricopeptide repeat protein [Alphaproteobacteria bacterium]
MMAEFMTNFHFMRPWLLLLLLIPFLLYSRYYKMSNMQSSWQKVIDKRLLSYLLVKGSAQKRKMFALSSFLAIIFAIIASAGPSFQKIEVPAFEVQNPLMIALNMSSDMNEKDLAPNRLTRAKYKIDDLLNMLKTVQAGLMVYSSEPFVISPLTDDMKILQNLLSAVDFNIMPANGDRLDRAIQLGVERIKSAGFNQGNMLIFTPDVGQKFDLAIEEAKKANKQNVKINIIGVTATANEKLRLVAQAGGGMYWNIKNDDNMISRFAEELNTSDKEMQKGKNLRNIWLDAGWYLLIIPLVCCAALFRKGILVIAFLLISSNAYAGFLYSDKQEGYQAYNKGDYETAISKFDDDNWLASSYYKLGDYQKSYELFSKDTSVTGLYNQGNALAKGGKISEAIKKYEEVLKLEPNHEDAKFNLEYLKKQQNQQQARQNKNNQDNKDDKNDSQNNKQNQQQDQTQSDQNSDEQQENEQESQGEQDAKAQQQQQKQGNDQTKQDAHSDKKDDKGNKDTNSTMNEVDDSEQKKGEESKDKGFSIKQGSKEEKYDEKMQAKIQQYREIPEDAGGLLRAFIKSEYQQNRYNEQ